MLIIGGGTVGENAAVVAAGMGADVVLLDINVERLHHLQEVLPANIKFVYVTDSIDNRFRAKVPKSIKGAIRR